MERLSSRANVEGVQGKEMKPERMRLAKKKKKKGQWEHVCSI